MSIRYDLVNSKHDTLLKLNLNKIQNKIGFSEIINNYDIETSLSNSSPSNLPYENTLESAKKYCIQNNLSGVVYKNGIYEVISGKYLVKSDTSNGCWLYL